MLSVSPGVTGSVAATPTPFPPKLDADAPITVAVIWPMPLGTANVCADPVKEYEHVTVIPDCEQFDGNAADADPVSATADNPNKPIVAANTPTTRAPRTVLRGPKLNIGSPRSNSGAPPGRPMFQPTPPRSS
jgi:hypothetical protein